MDRNLLNLGLVRVLIACDKFKGSLSAEQACEAIRSGLEAGGVQADWDLCPIADGGEGFAEALTTAMGGEWRECEALDALERPILAKYGFCRRDGDRVVLMEMAEASGYWRIAAEERDIMRATTVGTGHMIRHAAQVGRAERILIGIGGSATNDGGVGMAAALGVAFRDAKGWELRPRPAEMAEVAELCDGGRIRLPAIEVACDVENPLLGPNGATAVYGPQKGAGPAELAALESFLTRLVEACDGRELAAQPGAGAAGGLGFGLMQFAQARLRPGFEMVADALQLDLRIEESDLVITGEGSLDAQSLAGKGPVGLAHLARQVGKRVLGLAGRVSPEVTASGVFDATRSLEEFGLPLEESMRRGAELLERLASDVAGLLRS